MRLRRLALLCLTALLPAAAVARPPVEPDRTNPLLRPAWIFYEDDRVPVAAEPGGLYGPLVRIESPAGPGGGIAGTGFYVADCLIATNFHVVFGPGRTPEPGARVTVLAGLAEGRAAARTTARPVVYGSGSATADWALLEDGNCLGRRYGAFDLDWLSYRQAASLEGLSAAGIGIGKGGFVLDPDCGLHRAEGSLFTGYAWVHDCAAVAGMSGGPLFHVDEAGRVRVVALNSHVHYLDLPAETLRRLDPDGTHAGAKPLPALGADFYNSAVPVGNFVRYYRQLAAETAEGIREAQTLLAALGHDPGPVDGIAGPRTRGAVRAFQAARGDWPTGIVAEDLLADLRRAAAEEPGA